jgi:hypothetical protein
MCILPSTAAPVVASPSTPACPAQLLGPQQRQRLSVQALARTQSITRLARDHRVSRKFVYQQADKAEQALDDAFAPAAAADPVLFHLPVTKSWLRQLTLGLVLLCHSPLRGVVELLHDVFDYDLSLGTVFNTVQAAVPPAGACNDAPDLRRVRVGAHDEIFQAGQPVLVGLDTHSSYCYLLRLEAQRDADTWGVQLLDLQGRGFQPDAVIADAGPALGAAHAEVLPTVPCRSDVFHALQEVHAVVTNLENRAYDALKTCATLQRRIAHDQRRGRPANRSRVKQLSDALPKQAQALTLADDVALLARWLRHDVLGLAGPMHADRLALYDFILAELQARVPQAPQLLSRLVTYLRGQRDGLLAFAAQLDQDFAALAAAFAVAPACVRAVFAVQTLAEDNPQRWQREAPLRRLLGKRYFPLSRALAAIRRRTVRASSLVENYNSRLRSYFFLRRHLGNDYLTLLQFFLNHRRFPRSECPERVGKSPAEVLNGQSHAHWLELLGYQRFSRN